MLADFVDDLDSKGLTTITVDATMAWSALPPNRVSGWHAHRLSVVRGFARYLHVIDPVHQIPPTGVFPTPKHRATPFLYSDRDVAALMTAAQTFRTRLRAATLETLVGLLAVTGLRIGEALRVDRGDVDFDNGVIRVTDSKFNKSRQVPIHHSTVDALAPYASLRDRLSPLPANPAFFVSLAGTRLRYDNFHSAWLTMVEHAGLEARSAKCRPRPHDLRHTFAVRTLLGWYLTASPELLGLIVERLEQRTGDLS